MTRCWAGPGWPPPRRDPEGRRPCRRSSAGPTVAGPKCITMTAKYLPSIQSRTDLFRYRYPSGNACSRSAGCFAYARNRIDRLELAGILITALLVVSRRERDMTHALVDSLDKVIENIARYRSGNLWRPPAHPRNSGSGIRHPGSVGKWGVPGGHPRRLPIPERNRSESGSGSWCSRDLAPRHPCRLTVHFLIDAQLPPGLARWLTEKGHRCIHVCN